jgi:hypothetical protein
LGLTFFGLTPEYRTNIFSQIHQIVFHGNGGYDWPTVYNMPIWLRNFTFHKIKEWHEKQNEEQSKAAKQNSSNKPQIARPNIKPNYTTKASK